MAIATTADLRARFQLEEGRILLTGIQALVRLPVEQHRADARRGLNTATFISGYEGSPLGGYDLALGRESRLLQEHHIHAHPGLNEEIAATSIWGTQQVPKPRPGIDGVVGIWYGKAPGLDRAHDAMRHANLVGASPHGGVLVLVGDDPGCKSSTLASATEGALADMGMPVLYPGDVQELLDFGLHGIALSRYCGSWVAMKIVADVADALGSVDVDPQRVTPVLPPVFVDGQPWQHAQIPQTVPPIVVTAEPHVFRNRVIAARQYAVANGLNRIVVNPPDARIGIVASGKTWFELRQALADFGLNDDELLRHGVRLLKLGLISPVEPEIVQEFARGLEEILVIEEKRPFIERQIRDILYHAPVRPRVVGKEDEDGRQLVPIDGELTPDRMAAPLAARLRAYVDPLALDARLQAITKAAGRASLPMASELARAPFFCSGCPHNRSTIIPEGSLVGAGIGCHTLVQLANDPRREGTGLTQMGGEGAQWIGQAPFSEAEHIFQNLGDGTFFHSGSLAIRSAIASGVNITYKLLYNGHVAMTGGQDAVGAQPVPATVRLLLAEGAKRVIVLTDDTDKYPAGTDWPEGVDVWQRNRLDEAQRILRDTPGVTVLVYDQQCATEARRMRKRGLIADRVQRVVINELVCEGCGDCGSVSNCLSVQPVDTEFGRKTRIHQSSCNHDYSCLEGDCPSFVTIVPAKAKSNGAAKASIPAVPVDLPDPHVPDVGDGFNLYMMGIGGTGVVTANQIMATAAGIDGRRVVGLDQLGLSQKAGPVVSHLRIVPEGADSATRVTTGTADAYLAFDAMVATETRHLAVTGPERTVAIVSTSAVPTGAMIRDHDLHFPGEATIRARIDATTIAGRNVYVDALAIADGLLRNHMVANTVVLGAAFQAGALPLSAAAIEQAIELNGAEVARNLAAFHWGRYAAIDPAAVQRAVAVAMQHRGRRKSAQRDTNDARIDTLLAEAGLSPAMLALTRLRANELLAYQNFELAQRYIAFVRRVAEREADVAPGQSQLSEAVARNLFKLMAYKDEYEVARLMVDPRFAESLAEQFPEGGRVTYNLHPPLLRTLGMQQKLKLGPWFKPAFHALHAMRKVRGTPLDLFGYAHLRRIERKLIADYMARVDAELRSLTAANYARAVALAEMPDMIRGYEGIKLRNIERYRAALQTYAAEA